MIRGMQPAIPTRRRPLFALAVLGVVLLLAAGAAIAYFAGVFDEKGKFTAVPAPCPTVTPGLHLLGTGYTTKAGEGNSCTVLRPGTNTAMMGVYYAVGDTPGSVGDDLRQRAAGEFRELHGMGDEGYTNGALTVFRVSNLMVGVTVRPDTGTTDAQIKVFEIDLATRLAAR
jgi:hypothetical protein